jgi:Holliday junction resolvase RusA-like endonuclease
MDLLKTMRGALQGAAISLRVACTPVPAPRPRFTKTGIAFMPREYSTHAGECQREFFQQSTATEPFTGPCAVLVECASPRPKTTKLPAPRGDVDNFAKTYLDAITKTQRFWKDDTQVIALAVSKRWAEPGEAPGVTVTILPIP